MSSQLWMLFDHLTLNSWKKKPSWSSAMPEDHEAVQHLPSSSCRNAIEVSQVFVIFIHYNAINASVDSDVWKQQTKYCLVIISTPWGWNDGKGWYIELRELPKTITAVFWSFSRRQFGPGFAGIWLVMTVNTTTCWSSPLSLQQDKQSLVSILSCWDRENIWPLRDLLLYICLIAKYGTLNTKSWRPNTNKMNDIKQNNFQRGTVFNLNKASFDSLIPNSNWLWLFNTIRPILVHHRLNPISARKTLIPRSETL